MHAGMPRVSVESRTSLRFPSQGKRPTRRGRRAGSRALRGGRQRPAPYFARPGAAGPTSVPPPCVPLTKECGGPVLSARFRSPWKQDTGSIRFLLPVILLSTYLLFPLNICPTFAGCLEEMYVFKAEEDKSLNLKLAG